MQQIGTLPQAVNASQNRSLSQFQIQILNTKQETARKEKLKFLGRINSQRCSAAALYASDLIEIATVNQPHNIKNHESPVLEHISLFNRGTGHLACQLAPILTNDSKSLWLYTQTLRNMVSTPEEISSQLHDILTRYVCIVPGVMAPLITMHASHPPPSKKTEQGYFENLLHQNLSHRTNLLHSVTRNKRTLFPELRLIQYDCGKLQALDELLWKLKPDGHRVLIFTQMSRMLDIFEQFLNHHGHTYLRLDGTTKIEQRQALMERFNADKRIFCFILSTRSGGIGVNLTGADTVIFYDSDWNPTMDAQAQDRCHRIGQTRDVNIYRLISEKTIEENILKKAQQKRMLGDLAIEGGNFTTAFFKKSAIHELFGIEMPRETVNMNEDFAETETDDTTKLAQWEQALTTVEEDNDVVAARTARAEAAAEFAEFDESIPIDNDVKEVEEKSAEEERIDELITQVLKI